MEQLLLWPVGSQIDLGNDRHGRIVEIQIGENCCVAYRIAWWDGGSRRVEWFYGCELSGREAEEGAPVLRIGFRA